MYDVSGWDYLNVSGKMDFSFYSVMASWGSLAGQMYSKETPLKREVKMVEEQVDIEYISLHRYIRNALSDTEVLADHQLRPGRST